MKRQMMQETANRLKSKPSRQDKDKLDLAHEEKHHICITCETEVKHMKPELQKVSEPRN